MQTNVTRTQTIIIVAKRIYGTLAYTHVTS